MAKPLPGEGHWYVEPRNYVGDTGLIYVGFCDDCDYDTGKNATETSAAKRVSAHWAARHAPEEQPA